MIILTTTKINPTKTEISVSDFSVTLTRIIDSKIVSLELEVHDIRQLKKIIEVDDTSFKLFGSIECGEPTI